jgi:hypothetical protein
MYVRQRYSRTSPGVTVFFSYVVFLVTICTNIDAIFIPS